MRRDTLSLKAFEDVYCTLKSSIAYAGRYVEFYVDPVAEFSAETNAVRVAFVPSFTGCVEHTAKTKVQTDMMHFDTVRRFLSSERTYT